MSKDPYSIRITSDRVPGAAGYDFYVTCNGQPWGDDFVVQPASGRVSADFGFVIGNGELKDNAELKHLNAIRD